MWTFFSLFYSAYVNTNIISALLEIQVVRRAEKRQLLFSKQKHQLVNKVILLDISKAHT